MKPESAAPCGPAQFVVKMQPGEVAGRSLDLSCGASPTLGSPTHPQGPQPLDRSQASSSLGRPDFGSLNARGPSSRSGLVNWEGVSTWYSPLCRWWPTGTAVAHRGLIHVHTVRTASMAITALEATAVPSWGRCPVRMRHLGPQPRRLDHHRRPLPRGAEPTQICARPRNASQAWPASPYTASPHTGPSPHDAPDSPSLVTHAPSVKGSDAVHPGGYGRGTAGQRHRVGRRAFTRDLGEPVVPSEQSPATAAHRRLSTWHERPTKDRG